ncbi:MAG: response regulator [Candidatus Omnitrophota bacterium]
MKKILICDDEEGIRKSLELILGEKYKLIFAECGKNCMEQLKNHPDIPLVLTDIKMPKQNGIALTKEIKDLYPNIKVVMVTGYNCAEIAQQATENGADDYIVKPFETDDVLKKVESYMQ